MLKQRKIINSKNTHKSAHFIFSFKVCICPLLVNSTIYSPYKCMSVLKEMSQANNSITDPVLGHELFYNVHIYLIVL